MYLKMNQNYHYSHFVNFISLTKVFRPSPEKKSIRHLLSYTFSRKNTNLENSPPSGVPISPIMRATQTSNDQPSMRLEMSIDKINELLMHQQICAADIRCLDVSSKQFLKNLCLQNCLSRNAAQSCK